MNACLAVDGSRIRTKVISIDQLYEQAAQAIDTNALKRMLNDIINVRYGYFLDDIFDPLDHSLRSAYSAYSGVLLTKFSDDLRRKEIWHGCLDDLYSIKGPKGIRVRGKTKKSVMKSISFKIKNTCLPELYDKKARLLELRNRLMQLLFQVDTSVKKIGHMSMEWRRNNQASTAVSMLDEHVLIPAKYTHEEWILTIGKLTDVIARINVSILDLEQAGDIADLCELKSKEWDKQSFLLTKTRILARFDHVEGSLATIAAQQGIEETVQLREKLAECKKEFENWLDEEVAMKRSRFRQALPIARAELSKIEPFNAANLESLHKELLARAHNAFTLAS